jgi:hypothetical protein
MILGAQVEAAGAAAFATACRMGLEASNPSSWLRRTGLDGQSPD